MMADLDDFFAKKDKKKSKSKPKVLVLDEIAFTQPKRELVETKNPEEENDTPATTKPEKEAKEEPTEEEWKDFEEEQRKDYTGLKIGQLTINDEDEQSLSNDDEEGDSENNGGNEGVSKRTGGLAPWKKLVPAEEVTQIPMEAPKPSSKIYISPALRAQNLSVAARPKPRRTAPDITNADYFPSLDAARPEKQRKKKNEPAFEEVRHGGRAQRVEGPSIVQPVAATNRFQSLDEEDS